jgi:hypothetical protein
MDRLRGEVTEETIVSCWRLDERIAGDIAIPLNRKKRD